MPSPPDVILVLSPRMAKLVSDACIEFEYGHEASRPNLASNWPGLNEVHDALGALVSEIDDQLSREHGDATFSVNLDRTPDRRSDVAPIAERVADKMAKAARAAVEPKAEDMGGPDGLPQEPLVTEQDLADLAAEGERSPGVAPPDSEVQ